MRQDETARLSLCPGACSLRVLLSCHETDLSGEGRGLAEENQGAPATRHKQSVRVCGHQRVYKREFSRDLKNYPEPAQIANPQNHELNHYILSY